MARNNHSNSRKKNSKTYSSTSRQSTRNSDAYDNKTRKEDCSESRSAKRTEGRNDPSWYMHYPELIEGAGRFPYPNKPGSSVITARIKDAQGNIKDSKHEFTIPGVMVLDWVPTVGTSVAANSPVNIAAKEIYAKVRSAYSSSLDADAPDMITYMMALDSVFAYIAALKRIYRLLNAYTVSNYDMPDSILRALCLSAAEVQNLRVNKTQLWQFINELVLQSRKFTCPDLMDVFNRHYWMSDNIYTDAPSWNSQFYVFNLAGVYAYTADADPSTQEIPGCEVIHTPWTKTGRAAITPQVLYEFGTDLLNRLVLWDDAYTINGYLMRAFGDAKQFVVDEEPQFTQVTPIYSEEVLTQIENSRTIPGGYAWLISRNTAANTNFNLTQEPNSNLVVSNPIITVPSNLGADLSTMAVAAYTDNPIMINLRSELPTAIENVIATRLAAGWKCVYTAADSIYTARLDVATEIPLCWRIVKSSKSSTTWDSFNSYIPHDLLIYSSGTISNKDEASKMARVIEVSHFDWHPIIYIYSTNEHPGTWPTNAAGDYLFLSQLFDVHNVTTIRLEDLENLHKVCIYSEFNAFSIT